MMLAVPRVCRLVSVPQGNEWSTKAAWNSRVDLAQRQHMSPSIFGVCARTESKVNFQTILTAELRFGPKANVAAVQMFAVRNKYSHHGYGSVSLCVF